MKHIVDECFNDAITDKCLDNTIREHIGQCDKQCLNSALFEECASLYEKLLQTGNAEKFYASFYSNIVANAVDKFPGLLFPSCTTIAIKSRINLWHTHEKTALEVKNTTKGIIK